MASIAHRVTQLKRQPHAVLSAPTIHAACEQVNYHWRQRLLDPVTTLRAFMLQILHGNIACRAVRHLIQLDFSTTAYCNARQRLPLELFTQLAWLLTRAARERYESFGRWHGHRVLLIDGTGLSMPDTPALQQRFGQPGQMRPGCGFPVMHVLWLFDAATGLVVDLVHHRWNTHDLAQAHQMHPMMQEGDVLVGDRAFCSFAHLALLSIQGLHGVMRMHQRQIACFRPGRRCRQQLPKAQRQGKPTSQFVRRLGKCDQLVRWVKPKTCPSWMDEAQYAALPDELLVRELRYRPPARKGSRSQEITLVTTLIDDAIYMKEDLAELYHSRWQIETNLQHLKQTMGMDVLHCKSVQGVLKEMWMFMLVYNLVRLSMLEAARRQGCAPDRISFIDALDAWRYRLQDIDEVTLVVQPKRPGRHQPRRIKRAKDRYLYLTQPRQQHRLS